jgi:hypothetical protein
MPDQSGPLSIVLADPVLKAGLVELCRTGRVRAVGRRITSRREQVEPGLLKFEEEIAPKHEPIPPEAWEGDGRFLLEYPEGLRLEGSRAYVGREPLYMHEAWDDVRFDWGDLRQLVEQGQRDTPAKTGMPGRPSKSKHLIDDEFERRVKDRKVLLSLPDEAKALLEWLKNAHPQAARPTVTTIKNNIRDRYRGYQGNRQQTGASASRPKT